VYKIVYECGGYLVPSGDVFVRKFPQVSRVVPRCGLSGRGDMVWWAVVVGRVTRGSPCKAQYVWSGSVGKVFYIDLVLDNRVVLVAAAVFFGSAGGVNCQVLGLSGTWASGFFPAELEVYIVRVECIRVECKSACCRGYLLVGRAVFGPFWGWWSSFWSGGLDQVVV
jgi:hypothetical protein